VHRPARPAHAGARGEAGRAGPLIERSQKAVADLNERLPGFASQADASCTFLIIGPHFADRHGEECGITGMSPAPPMKACFSATIGGCREGVKPGKMLKNRAA